MGVPPWPWKPPETGVGFSVPLFGDWFHITKTNLFKLEMKSPLCSWVMWVPLGHLPTNPCIKSDYLPLSPIISPWNTIVSLLNTNPCHITPEKITSQQGSHPSPGPPASRVALRSPLRSGPQGAPSTWRLATGEVHHISPTKMVIEMVIENIADEF